MNSAARALSFPGRAFVARSVRPIPIPRISRKQRNRHSGKWLRSISAFATPANLEASAFCSAAQQRCRRISRGKVRISTVKRYPGPQQPHQRPGELPPDRDGETVPVKDGEVVLRPIYTPIESLPVVGARLCGQAGLLGRTRMQASGGRAFRAPQASRCGTDGGCAAPRQSAGRNLRLAALRAGTSPLSLRAEIPRGFGGWPPSAGSGFRRPRFGRDRIGLGRGLFSRGRAVTPPWTRSGAACAQAPSNLQGFCGSRHSHTQGRIRTLSHTWGTNPGLRQSAGLGAPASGGLKEAGHDTFHKGQSDQCPS